MADAAGTTLGMTAHEITIITNRLALRIASTIGHSIVVANFTVLRPI